MSNRSGFGSFGRPNQQFSDVPLSPPHDPYPTAAQTQWSPTQYQVSHQATYGHTAWPSSSQGINQQSEDRRGGDEAQQHHHQQPYPVPAGGALATSDVNPSPLTLQGRLIHHHVDLDSQAGGAAALLHISSTPRSPRHKHAPTHTRQTSSGSSPFALQPAPRPTASLHQPNYHVPQDAFGQQTTTSALQPAGPFENQQVRPGTSPLSLQALILPNADAADHSDIGLTDDTPSRHKPEHPEMRYTGPPPTSTAAADGGLAILDAEQYDDGRGLAPRTPATARPTRETKKPGSSGGKDGAQIDGSTPLGSRPAPKKRARVASQPQRQDAADGTVAAAATTADGEMDEVTRKRGRPRVEPIDVTQADVSLNQSRPCLSRVRCVFDLSFFIMI